MSETTKNTCTKCGTALPAAWVEAAKKDAPPVNPFADAFPNIFSSLNEAIKPLICWACKVGAK